MEPRNTDYVVANAVPVAEGSTGSARENGQGLADPAHRGLRTGRVHKGPLGTWEILTSPVDKQAGAAKPGEQTPGPQRPMHGPRRERKDMHRQVPWRRRKTRQSGKGVRKSERSTVLMKLGNRPEGPSGGKGAPGCGTVNGKDNRHVKANKRLNETTTDSEAGAASAGYGDGSIASHGPGVVRGGVPAHAKGRGSGRGWGDGASVRAGPAVRSHRI
jgi:hypothetical protein